MIWVFAGFIPLMISIAAIQSLHPDLKNSSSYAQDKKSPFLCCEGVPELDNGGLFKM